MVIETCGSKLSFYRNIAILCVKMSHVNKALRRLKNLTEVICVTANMIAMSFLHWQARNLSEMKVNKFLSWSFLFKYIQGEQAKMALTKLAINSNSFYKTTQFMIIFLREKVKVLFQSKFGLKNTQLGQLWSLLSKSRLGI